MRVQEAPAESVRPDINDVLTDDVLFGLSRADLNSEAINPAAQYVEKAIASLPYPLRTDEVRVIMMQVKGFVAAKVSGSHVSLREGQESAMNLAEYLAFRAMEANDMATFFGIVEHLHASSAEPERQLGAVLWQAVDQVDFAKAEAKKVVEAERSEAKPVKAVLSGFAASLALRFVR